MHADPDPTHYLPGPAWPNPAPLSPASPPALPVSHPLCAQGVASSARPHLTHTCCRPVCAEGHRSGRQEAPSITTVPEAGCDTPARQHRKVQKQLFRILVMPIAIQCPKAALCRQASLQTYSCLMSRTAGRLSPVFPTETTLSKSRNQAEHSQVPFHAAWKAPYRF